MAVNSTDSSSCGDGPGTQRELKSDSDIWRVSTFRTALPQVLATCAQSTLLLELGMMVGVPTIVIAALLNSETGLSMNSTQASWFAGIIFGVQPLGSVLSGYLSEVLGRKRSMMLVAVPQLIGWLLMYFSQDLLMIYISGFMMGFSIGFMEAPSLSYVGEICQPHLRANMCSLTSLNVPLGYLVMYLLGTILDWRTTALCSAAMPILTVLAITLVPESPMWLLRKDRRVEAEAALCWLRGWVQPADVRAEFASLQDYSEKSKMEQCQDNPQTRSPKKGQIYIEVPKNGNGPRLEEGRSPKVAQTFSEKLKDLSRPEMMRPLRLVVLYFFFYHCGGLTGLRPYMVKVFGQLKLSLDPYWLTVASALLQISGAVVCMFTIHRIGKRKISLVSMSACSLSVLLLGCYVLLLRYGQIDQPLVPMVLFATLFFFTNLGIGPVPWALISEVFPPRGRGMGGGISSGIYYLMFFLVTKTFLDIQGLLGLHGVFFLYGCLGVVGIVFVYNCVPETEGKRLEDIEKFFKDKKTDRVVPIN
ncbi:facilitated trehalose transporter Tret1-2 homolog isoform X2 [Homalodisca vitripennis]|uniref:facilitated trehalose transporter Tret1-2 homolog isoform X2 n=1 Tax=Homalodisca vitripennis TaxID=197043 RepID=UPI001EEB4716|nr:facilitated trehalose transporter Tret1-2 homolog isoform X2 [Homalodisca vitripennis]